MSERREACGPPRSERGPSGPAVTAGVLRDDVVAGWIDDACSAYLERCAVLHDTAERAGCAVRSEARELGEAVRDELIALAHAAQHFN